jgi:hypothetical protein
MIFGDASRQALLAALLLVLPGIAASIRAMPSIPFERSCKYPIVKSELTPQPDQSAVELRAGPAR